MEIISYRWMNTETSIRCCLLLDADSENSIARRPMLDSPSRRQKQPQQQEQSQFHIFIYMYGTRTLHYLLKKSNISTNRTKDVTGWRNYFAETILWKSTAHVSNGEFRDTFLNEPDRTGLSSARGILSSLESGPEVYS